MLIAATDPPAGRTMLVSKIEITNDLKGAFFPGRFDIAFKLMWESLKQKFTVLSKKAILIFTTCVRLFAQKFSKAKKS